MLRDPSRKAALGLLAASVILLFSSTVAYAITWSYLGHISGSTFYSPTDSVMWGGYTEISTYRYVYGSHDLLTYGHRVLDIQNTYGDSNGTEYPALDFDDQEQGGGFHTALHATTWYQTDAPVFDHWRFDDNGDGRREQVRLALYPPQLYPGDYYYYDQQFEDLDFPYYRNSGELNSSAYWVWPWGGRITSEWMCKFFYASNNTFSRQCAW